MQSLVSIVDLVMKGTIICHFKGTPYLRCRKLHATRVEGEAIFINKSSDAS